MDCVYIVTAGDYSDYRIEGVFTTKEKAQGYIDACIKRPADIEVWKLNEWTAKIEQGLKSYNVWIDEDGNVQRVELHSPQKNEFSQRLGYIYDQGDFETAIWAKTPEHAIKVANERRTIIIATNRWKKGWVTNE